MNPSHPPFKDDYFTPASAVSDVIDRNLIFVGGKGGVGKTLVSQALALSLSKRSRVLWVAIEDPLRPPGELLQVGERLWHLNCEANRAFEEYMELKISAAFIRKIFLQNKLIRYLSSAAPGLHELVLLGKIWFERQKFDHVVVDMPSTGHGLAMFQSVENFARLFGGGPIARDAEQMLVTLRDPESSGNLVVALPEEMPLQESLELGDYLLKLFPKNPAAYLINRRFPNLETADHSAETASPETWSSPVPASATDYAQKRSALEHHNLDLWRNRGIPFRELPYLPPSLEEGGKRQLVNQLAEKIGHLWEKAL